MGGPVRPSSAESQGGECGEENDIWPFPESPVPQSAPKDEALSLLTPFEDLGEFQAVPSSLPCGASEGKAPRTDTELASAWEEILPGTDSPGGGATIGAGGDDGSAEVTAAESENDTEGEAGEAPGCDLQRSHGVFPILGICLDHQDGSAAEKAILDHAALLALLEAAAAPESLPSGSISAPATAATEPPQSGDAEAEPTGAEAEGPPTARVVGLLGHKGTMRQILGAHGLTELDSLAKEWDQRPGIYAYLSAEHGLGASGGPPVVLVFFWHPGQRLPLEEARGSVTTSFVRYVMEMAGEVLVCLESGDVEAVSRTVSSAAAADIGNGQGKGGRRGRQRQPAKGALQEITEDSVKILPGFHVVPTDAPKWRNATLSLPASGQSGILVQTEATGEVRMVAKAHSFPAARFPAEFQRMISSFRVLWEGLPQEEVMALVQYGAPSMWEEVEAEAQKAMRLAEEERAAAAGGGTLSQLQEVMCGAALFFLQQSLPHQEHFVHTQGLFPLHPKGPLPYPRVGYQMAKALGVQPFASMTCLHGKSAISISSVRPHSRQPAYLGIAANAWGQGQTSAAKPMARLALSPKQEFLRIHGSEVFSYGGPLFLGQRVRLISREGEVEVVLRSSGHSELGPAAMEGHFCFVSGHCDGTSELHRMQIALTYGGQQPDLWHGWMTSLAVQAALLVQSISEPAPNSHPPAAMGPVLLRGFTTVESYVQARTGFLSLVFRQLQMQWVLRMSATLDDWQREQDRKGIMDRGQETRLRRAVNILRSLVDDDSSADKPVMKLSSCHLNRNLRMGQRGQGPEIVRVGWSEEDKTHGQRHWDMLSLSPAVKDTNRVAKCPLEAIVPRLMSKDRVLVGPEGDVELLQWYLLRNQQPLMFLRNKEDSSVSVFLGKEEVKKLARGADAAAFDEASKTLVLWDRAKETITTHRFNDRFTHLDPTPVEIDLSQTQSQGVQWMSLSQGGTRLVAVAGCRVQVFALDQEGMARPGPIPLVRPFSGCACLSPDGRSLFALSTQHKEAAAPTPAPAPWSTTERYSGTAEAVPKEEKEVASEEEATSAAEVYAEATREEGVDPATGKESGVPQRSQQEGPGTVEAQGGALPAGEAPRELALDVYLLGSMAFFGSFPLTGVTGSPGEWSLGATEFGMQHNLLLHHRSSGAIQSRILDIQTTEEEYRMRPEAVVEERKPGEQLFAASPAPALEAMYHAMDKFPTSPCLSSATRALALRLVLPIPAEPSPASSETPKQGDTLGAPGMLKSHVASLQEKLETESAKDFSRLALHVTTVKSAAELPLCSASSRIAEVAAGTDPEASSATSGMGPQPLVQLYDWADRVMCLVPVQIARAQGNSLHPMKDGLHLPPDALYTDAVSLSRLLSFGPYESLLASWQGPVKVVSSMGKQSSGKSYLMNHLSGSLLDISGGRCTDGVWLTVREAGGCLYVLLDFEGLGSVERTEQEDMLLSVFNAAISSLTIFNKRECLLDKDTQEVFVRFQAGVNLMAKDAKLFRGYFYLAIKDVAENDFASVRDEFTSKLKQLLRKDKDNFLRRMFAGQFCVAPMAPFHDAAYQDDVEEIARLLKEEITAGYSSGPSFLQDVKLLLAQMCTRDWTPMDAKRVSLRVSLVHKQLPSVLRLGCNRASHLSSGATQASAAGEEAMAGKESALANVDTLEPIVTDPEAWASYPGFHFKEDKEGEEKAGADSDEASWETQLRGLLSSTPDQGLELPGAREAGRECDPGRVHRRLREMFEDFAPRASAWGEAQWHGRLQVFLQALVCRRATRVLGWVDASCKEFEGEEEVRQQRASYLEALDAMRTAARLCSAQCDSCFLLCVEPRGHSLTQPHSCGGTHLCQESCTFCFSIPGPTTAKAGVAGAEQGEEAAEQGLRCQFKAGHQGHHNCQIRKHLCQAPCSLAEVAGNCALVCSQEAGHEDEHLCNSTEHRCKAGCSLPACSNPCTLPHQHTGDKHRCHESACPSPCAFPGCSRGCGGKDHLHSLAGDCTHLCGQEHACGAVCESEGFCELKTEVERKRELFVGKRSEFEFELRTVQEGVRKRCAKVVPPNELSHLGPHCHTTSDVSPHHYCTVACPQCEYVCNLPHGHCGVHETSHGSMKNTRFAAESPNIDLLDRKYEWGESGQAEMCGMHCRVQGRGHIHLSICNKESGGSCAVAGRTDARHETRTYGPDHEVPKDEYTHEAFWRSLGFRDPCTEGERAEFGKCSHICSSEEHVLSGSSSIWQPVSRVREKVYCTESLWHAPRPAESKSESHPGGSFGERRGGGHVSSDGHAFPCTHSSAVPHHVIFVIDKSKSMRRCDVRPQYVSVSAAQNNRLGCVYESMIRFIRLRRHLGSSRDYMSIVLFDDEAIAPVKLQGMQEGQVYCALQHKACRGTNFCAALDKAGQMVNLGQVSRRGNTAAPVIIFLSDGGSGFGDPLAKARELKRHCPGLTINTIKFGNDTTHRSVLPAMAAIGQGQYRESLDDVQLARTFEHLAASLRPNISALMAPSCL